MKQSLVTLLFLFAVSARAQVIAPVSGGLAVATDGRVQMFDETGRRLLWSARGVARPSKIVVAGGEVAVIDTFANEVAVVRNGSSRILTTGATPVDGAFAGAYLFVLARDGRVLERFSSRGGREAIALAADPAFLRVANGFAYVYSRVEGVIQEISLADFVVTRRATIAPFAADFETDGRNGYLLFPREARVRGFPLSTLKVVSEAAAGAVPSDMTLLGAGTAVSARRLAIADPAAKRIWTSEGLQSLSGAFARGFIRGLLGVGLFSPAHSEFPTGVDRVLSRGGIAVAYDSATGTLYRFRGSKSSVIAKGIAPAAFTVTGSEIAVWENGSIRLIR